VILGSVSGCLLNKVLRECTGLTFKGQMSSKHRSKNVVRHPVKPEVEQPC
jgi:hypothetical protein